MRSSWRRVGVTLCWLVPACAEPPAPVAPVAAVTMVAAAPAPPPAPDMSPVGEPRGLLAVARWARPIEDADRALQVLGVPLTLDLLLAMEAPDVRELFSESASLDAALSLDPDAPDDEPKVLAAVSIPVASAAGVERLAEKQGVALVARSPGVWRLSPKKGDGVVCDLALALGPAPARVVCAPGERDLEALRGWLVRGLASDAPEPGNVTATFRAAPLKERYLTALRPRAAKLGDEAREGLSNLGVRDAELLAAPEIALDEGLRFLDDLNRVDLWSAFAPKPPELSMRGAVRFGGQSSWLTRALTDANDKPGPAPAMFWRVPRDASAASWGTASDPHLYDGVRRVLRKALAEVLGRLPMLRPADKDSLEAFVDAIPRAPSSWVSAQGVAPRAKTRETKGAKTPADTLAEAKARITSALGWTIVGVDAPASDYVAWAKQGLDVYARAVRVARETIGAAKTQKPGDLDALALLPRVTMTTSPPGWPRGTVAVDARFTYDADLAALALDPKAAASARAGAPDAKKKPEAKGSLTVRLAIVPDGERAWIGLSADLDALQKRVGAVMPGAPRDGTLAAREGLEALRQPGQVWAGFFSVGALIEAIIEGVEKEKPDVSAAARATLAAMPNKGRTPILMLGTGTGGAQPSSATEVRVQAGTIADLAGLVGFFMSPAGGALWKKADAP